VTHNNDWTTAEEYCRVRQGHLVGIFNSSEQQALAAYLRQQATAGKHNGQPRWDKNLHHGWKRTRFLKQKIGFWGY